MSDERTPVPVGIDLRPIPLEMSDGKTYHFNADPPKEFFATVARVKAEGRDSGVDDYEFVDSLREVLLSQIVTDEDQEAYTEANYGLAALNALSKSYAKAVLGDPT